MYVCKGENSRAVAAGLDLAVRRPPVQKQKICKVYGTNIIFFCISKSKIEAAFRDKVSMSAVKSRFRSLTSQS